MKFARVKIIFKKNSPLDFSNFMLVSILSIVSKNHERSISTQLNDFIKNNNLLYETQSGFRGSHSTDTCLIHLFFHYIKGNNAKGLYTGMIMLDLLNLLDTVDRSILCKKKLEGMGLSQQTGSNRIKLIGNR